VDGQPQPEKIDDPQGTIANPTVSAYQERPTYGQPQQAGLAPSAAAAAPRAVYAVGRLAARFPNLGVEKEFAQLVGGMRTAALVEVDQLKSVLREPENRYLGRHLCWVFVTQHVDTFTIAPHDAHDVAQLVDALAPTADENVIQAVVGGPPNVPVPAQCVGPGLPVVAPERVLSFTMDEFIDSLPPTDEDGQRPDESSYRAVVGDLFSRLTRRADNRGIADEHRAFNYLALHYPPAYHTTVQALGEGKSLIGVDARHVHSGDRRLVSVRLAFRSRRTEVVERYQCLVDVTDLFPFLASPLSATYD
jgi:hypothetical protein